MQFGQIRVIGRLGETATFFDVAIRNAVPGPGDYGHNAEMLLGRRWKPVFLSPLRMMKPSVGAEMTGGTIPSFSGTITFEEADREQAGLLLKQGVSDYLDHLRGLLDATTIDVPDAVLGQVRNQNSVPPSPTGM